MNIQGVNAAFSGHFHQNVVSKADFGMDMIITAPLSIVLESSGKPKQEEVNGRGIRIVEVHLNSPASSRPDPSETCIESGDLVVGDKVTATSGGVRNGGYITHRFVPIGC